MSDPCRVRIVPPLRLATEGSTNETFDDPVNSNRKALAIFSCPCVIVIETFEGACLGQAHVTNPLMSKSLDFEAVATVDVVLRDSESMRIVGPNLHQRSPLVGNPFPDIVTVSPPLSGHEDGEIPVIVVSFWYANTTLPEEIVA